MAVGVSPSRFTLLQALLSRGRLVLRLLRDRRVPLLLRFAALLPVVYVVSPFDFLPDVAPLVGQLDDLGILLLGAEAFIALCPRHVVAHHQVEIQAGRGFTPSRTAPSGTADGEVIDADWRPADAGSPGDERPRRG
jgi:uncharacterized membrane protein YkvA (DUF1232 family)